jgi:hypothetical protein
MRQERNLGSRQEVDIRAATNLPLDHVVESTGSELLTPPECQLSSPERHYN